MTDKSPYDLAVANVERTKRLLDHVQGKYDEALDAAAALQPIGQGTSPEVASIAAKGLSSPESLTHDEVRTVCACALSQREGEAQ